jgi:hypothetical protein
MTPVFVLTLADVIAITVIGIIVFLVSAVIVVGKIQIWLRRKPSVPVKPWIVDRDGRVRTEKDRPVQLKAKGQQ